MVLEVRSLVERDAQIDALASAIEESTDTGHVVLISGEAGFGKTTLIRAVTGELDHRFTILKASCEPVGIPAPFAPLFDLIDYLRARTFHLHSGGRSGRIVLPRASRRQVTISASRSPMGPMQMRRVG